MSRWPLENKLESMTQSRRFISIESGNNNTIKITQTGHTTKQKLQTKLN